MTFAVEAVVGGFVGEVVSRCMDISWVKIKEAITNRKNKYQNIESQVYCVIVNVLNQITHNKFMNDQDKIYQAAERLLKSYKDNRCDSIEVVKSGMQILCECVNDDKYVQFKILLYQELSKDDYEELYREIILVLQDRESIQASRIEKKIDDVKRGVEETNRKIGFYYEDNKVGNISHNEHLKSRTQEYADKWNANMFLNDFDERDENAGVNVKLRDVYINFHLPHYKWGKNYLESSDLERLLTEYIEKNKKNDMLLILGQPGIGKSTLITWIAAKFYEYEEDILIYKFAEDLKNVNWGENNISEKILDKFNFSYDKLEGKTLIFDGFDEVSVEGDRISVLDNLYEELVYKANIKYFSLIVTCRENCIQGVERVKCKYITLQPWDKTQIVSFCNIFQKKTRTSVFNSTKEKLLENKEIFGIPLILYMVLALNIFIENEGTIVDVYDKIFALDGGIYERCIDYRRFADRHRIAGLKKQIHQMSRELAMWMFENNPEEASVSQKEYINICNQVMRKIKIENTELEQDFKIGSYFKLIKHCEGVNTEELSFIHRSIYEYFVVETICSSIEDAILELSEESQKKLAGNIARFLKKGQLTNTIKDYLQYKIIKIYNRLNNEKKTRFYLWLEEAIQKMMEYGMFYYTGDSVQNYKNIISKEVHVLINLIQILQLLRIKDKNKYIMEKIDKKILEKYIKYYEIELGTKPEKIIANLSYMSLSYLSLKGINLNRAEMIKVDLRKTDLSNANLIMANLTESDFRGANLKNAYLKGANLTNADLREVDLTLVELVGANLSKTKINASMWTKYSIKNVILQLKEASFKFILVKENDALKIVYKNDLFSRL